ncbi:MAG: aspartate/glutamate racemase family protein [Vicinamibacterales bacterium]
MSILGLIGGIAPGSTVDYYQRIIARYREQLGDDRYPGIVINSIDLTTLLRLVEAGRLRDLTDYLVGELERLHAAGADFALLASNTPHLVFDDLQPRSPLPLISIVEAACTAAARAGYTRVGLLGTRFTMGAGFYPAVFARSGIEVMAPAADEQEYVHHAYMTELVHGAFLPDTRAALLALIARMRQRDGIQAVLLGGTELPLILRGVLAACPLVDTTAVHVDAAVSRLVMLAA